MAVEAYHLASGALLWESDMDAYWMRSKLALMECGGDLNVIFRYSFWTNNAAHFQLGHVSVYIISSHF